jgi:hypothetical protein
MKIQKKLTLSSQTLRPLTVESLTSVAGAISVDPIRCHKSALPACKALARPFSPIALPRDIND